MDPRTAGDPASPSQAASRQPSFPGGTRFREISFVGAGGMGHVFRAWDPELKRWMALKLAREDTDEALIRFTHEAQAMARVDHPYVAKIFEVGEAGGTPYFAMPFIEAPTLGQVAPELTAPQLARIMAQVADGVEVAHRQGVFHRDIKPDNILVERAPHGGLHPYLLDFGLAKTLDAPGLTRTGQLLGTPRYMSPERVLGEGGETDAPGDVYGLGATFYEALAGRPAFDAPSEMEVLRQILEVDPLPLRRVRPSIPADLALIVQTCMAKEPGRRYASAAALAEDLNRFLDGRPILACHPGTLYRARIWFRRHRALAVSLAVFLPLLTVVSGVALRAVLRAQRLLRSQLDQGEKLVGFLVGDVFSSVENVLPQDKLSGMARQALAYYETLPLKAQDEADQRRQCQALLRVGSVLIRQGHLAESRRAYERALAISSSHAGRSPMWGACDLAARLSLAELDQEEGAYEKALQGFRTLQVPAERLVREIPGDAGAVDSLLSLSYDAGQLLYERGDARAAQRELEQGLARVRAMAPEMQAQPKVREHVFWYDTFLGHAADALGDGALAESRYREALGVIQALSASRLQDRVLRRCVSVAQNNLASFLCAHGKPARALELLDASRAVMRELVALDSGQIEYRADLAAVQSQLGTALARSHRRREALASLEEGAAVYRSLVATDPLRMAWKTDFAALLANQASLLLELGQPGRAEPCSAEAVALCRDGLAREPGENGRRVDLAEALETLGDVRAAQHRPVEAGDAWREGLDRLAGLEGTEGRARKSRIRLLLRLHRVEAAREALRGMAAEARREPEFQAFCASHGLKG